MQQSLAFASTGRFSYDPSPRGDNLKNRGDKSFFRGRHFEEGGTFWLSAV